MRRSVCLVVLLSLAMVAAARAAQSTVTLSAGRGGSPHVRSTWTVHGATITVEYGRPYLKGRPETDMMPPGEPWRVGADEATILTSDKPLTFGALHLAPGTYTINAQPGTPWQFIVGTLEAPGQWGIPYQPALEIGRAPMTVARAAPPRDQLLLVVTSTPTGGTFAIDWGTVSATVPFHVG